MKIKQVLKKLVYLLIIQFAFVINVHAQLIDKTVTPYPTGTSQDGCPGPSCKLILPTTNFSETYILQIHLVGALTFGMETGEVEIDTIYTYSECPDLAKTTTYTIDKMNGIIEITPGQYCLDYDNSIDIQVSANDHDGTTDNIIFTVPFQRLPVKTVMVLDISGSMGRVEANGDSRWDILKASTEKFMTLYEYFKIDGDEVGVTYFTNTIYHANPPIADGFLELTEWDATPSTTHSIINDDMNSRGPLYSTAMGAGLFNAKTKLKANTTDKYRKIAVLITDGLQNVQPMVNLVDGNTLSDGSTLNDYSTNNIDSIRYFTIATWGATAGPMAEVLSNIAINSNADNLIQQDASGNEVQNHFFTNQLLKNILHGGSPQIIDEQSGNVSSSSLDHKFKLNANITKVAFIVAHKEGDDINLELKKGESIITDYHLIDKPTYKMIGLTFQSDDNIEPSEGEYNLKVSGTTQDNYIVTCIADDHLFNYNFSVDKSIYKTGDTIQFSTKLSYAGHPLTNPEDSVKVILLKPGDDINHLLGIYETPELETNEDDGTPEQQKLEYLYNNNEGFYEALIPKAQIVKLTNEGNGVFTGEYYDTYLTGIYEAIFIVKAKDDLHGEFNRRDLKTVVFKYGQSNPVEPEIVTDNINPSIPSNLASSNITQNTLSLEWYPSTDASGISNYQVFLNGNNIATVYETNYLITGLNPDNTYNFSVIAEDNFGNLSDQSNTLEVTTLAEVDNTVPSTPENFSLSNLAQTSVYLSWGASNDLSGIKEYVIYKNGEPMINTQNTVYSVTDLAPNTNYSFYITVIDNANNESEPTNELGITTLEPIKDITAPTKLMAENISIRSLSLKWEKSESNIGILEYNIYQNGSLIASTVNTTYYVSNLFPSTEYKFHVIARDNNGNLSDPSNELLATTQNKSLGNIGLLGFTIKPKNKYGYYLGPGFKSRIKYKYLPKKPRDPMTHKSSIQDDQSGNKKEISGDPFLKNIVDNLDGSYLLILANVAPKTNPDIEISIGNEVVHSGPIYKIPMWYYILLIIFLILVIVLKKHKKTGFYKLLWTIFILLLIIIILHRTGQLFFLYLM